jgi:hypothetical protein
VLEDEVIAFDLGRQFSHAIAGSWRTFSLGCTQPLCTTTDNGCDVFSA